MRGVYTVRDTLTTVTTAQALLYLGIHQDSVIEILSARVTCQDENTSEQLLVTLGEAAGSVGGGDALTPRKSETGQSVSSTIAKGGNTAITGMTQDGDSDSIASGGANKLGGWEYVPLPEERVIISPSGQLTLETQSTIASSTLTAEISYRELGG